MRKIARILVTAVLLVLVAHVAFASFDADVRLASERSNEIYRDELATFSLSIQNNNPSTDSYLVYTLDPNWVIYTEPRSTAVPGESTRAFELFVSPTSGITRSGQYSFTVTVKSTSSGASVSRDIHVLVKSDAQREFTPAVSTLLQIGDSGVVDPREGIDATVRLINRNALHLERLNVFLESNLIQDMFTVNIDPNGEVIRQFTYDVPSSLEPQEDTLSVKIYLGETLISDRRFEYEIRENDLPFEWASSRDDRFLKNTYRNELTNIGNIDRSQTFTYELSRMQSWFTKTTPKAEYADGMYNFPVSLGPNESQEIQVVTNYRPFVVTVLLLLLAIVLVIAGYYLFRTPILVSKKATVVAERDGGTSEIKIMLNIRNRTNKVLENIKVIDRIPDITEIEKEFSVGTLKPTKIVRHSKKGTLIRWDFPSVDGYEERIITYRIHSKLGIVGDLELPKVVVSFTTPRGLSRRSKSE